jgi:hypothetical protein
VAEDLVELSVYLTSQNMKIDAHDHVGPLDTAVDKIKLFNIGMSESTSSAFTIKYLYQLYSIVSKFSLKLSNVSSFYTIFNLSLKLCVTLSTITHGVIN